MVDKHRATEFLGVNYGTARSRLTRLILFDLAKKDNLDNCYRCGKKIKSIEEFSIEHKKPWFNRDKDLFWDLDNIAFSHFKCNSQEPNLRRRKQHDDKNKAWCSVCKKWKDKKHFNKKASRWNGVANECRGCRKLRYKRDGDKWDFSKSRKWRRPKSQSSMRI